MHKYFNINKISMNEDKDNLLQIHENLNKSQLDLYKSILTYEHLMGTRDEVL